MKLLIVVLFCLATSYTLYKLYRIRGWAKRLRRLCLSCHTITRPDQAEDGTFFCMVCGHRGPVELDSRSAVEHFDLIGQKPPDE